MGSLEITDQVSETIVARIQCKTKCIFNRNDLISKSEFLKNIVKILRDIELLSV